jgi:hypothetical protein
MPSHTPCTQTHTRAPPHQQGRCRKHSGRIDIHPSPWMAPLPLTCLPMFAPNPQPVFGCTGYTAPDTLTTLQTSCSPTNQSAQVQLMHTPHPTPMQPSTQQAPQDPGPQAGAGQSRALGCNVLHTSSVGCLSRQSMYRPRVSRPVPSSAVWGTAGSWLWQWCGAAWTSTQTQARHSR